MARKAATATTETSNKKAAPKKPALSKEYLRESLETKLSRYYGTIPQEATKDQLYRALLLSIKDILSQKRTEFKKNVNNQRGKKVYYLCMEFLTYQALQYNIKRGS